MDEHSVRLILYWVSGLLSIIAYCIGVYHLFIKYQWDALWSLLMPLWPFVEGVVIIARSLGVAV
jgi:hypothetical protein